MVCAVLLLALIAPPAVQTAPFTDADLPGAVRLASDRAAPSAPGTERRGVLPAGALRLSGLQLNAVEGLVEVWVRPGWDGCDGRAHTLWSMEAGGRRLALTKSDRGWLRAELRTPGGMTVARADVRGWRRGVWRHVAVGWHSNRGRVVGLPLWVDRVAVDGPVTPRGVFEAAALPTAIMLEGDGSAFDELIVRTDLKGESRYGMVGCVYRDHLRTAPMDGIEITHNPTRTPSDTRAVVGFEKPFGLTARHAGRRDPLTEQVTRYSQWAYFDAKPFIRWSTSDPQIATVSAEGRVRGVAVGACTLTAGFRGRSARYSLQVISPDRPDAGVICIELLPRRRSDAARDRLVAGEIVTARARFGSFGMRSAPAGMKVRLTLREDTNRNFQPDSGDRMTAALETATGAALAPGAESAVEFRFAMPARPTWMALELDPGNRVDELCEANNTIVELTTARPIQMGFNPAVTKACLTERRANHVGSLSYYDWIRAEKLRMDLMLRESVYPTTGPNGVEEAYRIDAFTPLALGKWEDEPFNRDAVWFDGGFPVNENVDLMNIDCAIIHEFGHTILSQPDLYGYPVSAGNVLLRDGAGQPVAGSPDLPVVAGESTLPFSSGQNVPCGVGYASLMDGCQLWLHPSQAGHIMYYRGYRPDRFWGTQGRLIPTRANWLMVTDAFDRPLIGAAVYVYHVSQAPVQDSGAKFFADRPKFTGQTDGEGRFVFPGETDADWDDPETDSVDGAVPVWNPFGTPKSETAFTPNVWEVEGLLLLRIVSGAQTEYRFLDLTEFNSAFLSGETVCGRYAIRTSLEPAAEPTQIVRRPVPEAVRRVNLAPIASAPAEITVRCGQTFEIDGSASRDPEGQPLLFRWNAGGEWLRGSLTEARTLRLTAPAEPKELEYRLWVLDGVRSSEAATIRVHVVR